MNGFIRKLQSIFLSKDPKEMNVLNVIPENRSLR